MAGLWGRNRQFVEINSFNTGESRIMARKIIVAINKDNTNRKVFTGENKFNSYIHAKSLRIALHYQLKKLKR